MIGPRRAKVTLNEPVAVNGYPSMVLVLEDFATPPHGWGVTGTLPNGDGVIIPHGSIQIITFDQDPAI